MSNGMISVVEADAEYLAAREASGNFLTPPELAAAQTRAVALFELWCAAGLETQEFPLRRWLPESEAETAPVQERPAKKVRGKE